MEQDTKAYLERQVEELMLKASDNLQKHEELLIQAEEMKRRSIVYAKRASDIQAMLAFTDR